MKTARQLLVEAARIMSRATKAHAAGDTLILQEEEAEDLLKDVQQWLQEELDEASLADGVRPSEDVEPPTDERWFAAYLRAQDKVIEAFMPETLQLLSCGTKAAKERVHELWTADACSITKAIADNALAAAREQAKESLAKPQCTE